MAVQLVWQKFVPSRSPFHILIPRIRIWRVNATPHQHHTASTHQLWHHGTIGSGADCYCKSGCWKARKIQQLQLQMRVSPAQAESKWRAVATTWWSAQAGYPSTESLGELLQVNFNRVAVYRGRSIATYKFADLVKSKNCV